MTASIALPGHFRVDDVIGRSPHTAVVRAFDERVGRPVAVKVLQPARWLGLRECAALRSRVADAMGCLTGLRHPYLASIYEVGEFGDALYVSREYVDGEPVGLALQRRQRLSLYEAGRIVRQVACGIDALVAAGTSHGAVNAGNVFLTRRGARLTDAAFARTAGAFEVGGVRCHLQRHSALGDDLAALAALLVDLVCGRGACRGASSIGRAYALPRAMRSMVGRVLAGHHRRYESAGAFAQALFPDAGSTEVGAFRVNTVTGLVGAAALMLAPSVYVGASRPLLKARASASAPAPSLSHRRTAPAASEDLRELHRAAWRQGPALMVRPEVADLVGLRGPQRLAIEGFLKEQRSKVQNIVDAAAAGQRIDTSIVMGALRRETRARILGLLDSGQLARWNQLERLPDELDAPRF